MNGDRVVFRHRGMVVAFVLGSAFLLLLSPLAWAQADAGNVVGVAVMSAVLWFVWAVGWGSKVVISEPGVVVVNGFVRHELPWPVFGDFEVDGGLTVARADGSELGVLSYGGSLAGAMNGYRMMTRTRDEMAAACDRFRVAAGTSEGGYRRRITTSWPVLVIYLAVLEGLAVGVDVSHHVF